MTVFATTDPESKHEGIGAFLVERDWEGVSTGKAIPKLGQRCSNTTALHFKDVRVPAENVIAPPGKGFVLAMKTFSRTRPIIGAFAVGAARSAMEYAIDYAKRRKAFGMPLSGFQAIQFKLAEMYQKVETSRLLVRLSAWEADQGLDPTLSASITKFYSTEAALETVNDAMQILGGYGYTRMFPLEKLLRDVRLLMIYEGTSEVQRVIVSGHLLNAFEPAMHPLDQVPMLGSRNPEEEASETAAWRCGMCGHVHNGTEPPEVCPYCFAARGAFRQVWPYDAESDGQSK
jgi:acyl-CoA dehydrogenase